MKKWDIVIIVVLVVTILGNMYNFMFGYFILVKQYEFPIKDKIFSLSVNVLVIIVFSLVLISILKKGGKS